MLEWGGGAGVGNDLDRSFQSIFGYTGLIHGDGGSLSSYVDSKLLGIRRLPGRWAMLMYP